MPSSIISELIEMDWLKESYKELYDLSPKQTEGF